LSLPLNSVVAPASACRLAAVSWAVWPFPVARYSVVTLSLWSWSMSAKLRVVRHCLPSAAVPGDGTRRFPAAMAALAAWKNATALQAPTWVNGENWPLMFSPATQLACCRNVSCVADAAGLSPAFTGGAVVPVPVPVPVDGVEGVADGDWVADMDGDWVADMDGEADADGEAGW
jgi:hypothetical protein